MEKNSNVPVLRFPEFKNEWTKRKLRDLSSLITKGTTPQKFVEVGINFIKLECFQGDKIAISKCLYIDEQTNNKELRRSILEEGDILFAIAGATVGKSNIVTKEILPANTNQALAIIRLKEHENKLFVFHNLKSDKMQRYIIDNIAGGAQPNLNLEQMGNFAFSLPDPTEQQKIATFLTSVDEKLQALKKKKSLLEEYKKGVMQRIFNYDSCDGGDLYDAADDKNCEETSQPSHKSKKSQFRQLSFRDENGEEFPDWEELRLRDVADRVIEKNKENNLNVLTISAQHGLISQLEYFNKSVSAKDVTGYYLLHENDFAYNKSYSNGYPMGAIKRLKKYDKGVVSTLYICFRFKENVSNEFFEHYFEMGLQNVEIEQVAQEGIRNHGLLNVGVNDFFNINLHVPSFQEQTKIAFFLSAIDEKINHCTKQIEKTSEWKKGLLQKMFC